jgi:tetratricopeptide (TPR) repeat protein
MGRLWMLPGIIGIAVIVLTVRGMVLRYGGVGTGPQSAGAAQQQDDGSFSPTTFTPDQLFARSAPAVALVEVRDSKMQVTGIGSGFFVSDDGLLVTNFHVIRNASFASVRTAESTFFVEGVAATDAKRDLAVLKVLGSNVPHLKLNQREVPPVGTRVFAIGNPAGLTNTLTEGLVSGHRNASQGFGGIQTSAAVSSGSSGGPLLTADGVVIGVTSSGLTVAQNINFAIPAGDVRELIRVRTGDVKPLASAAADALDPMAAKAFTEALNAMDRGDMKQAVTLLAPLRERQKNNPVYWYTTGYLHEQLQNLDLAVKAQREAIRLRPNFYGAYCYLGTALGKQNKIGEAIEALEAAEKLEPDDPLAPMTAAVVYQRVRRFSDALPCLDRALKLAPKDPELHRLKGNALMNTGKYPEAFYELRTALKIDPQYAYTYVTLGDTYGRINQLSQAEDAYKKAIELRPDYALAYLQLGGVSSVLRKRDQARDAYRNAARFDPGGVIGELARRAMGEYGTGPAYVPNPKPAPSKPQIEIKRKQ